MRSIRPGCRRSTRRRSSWLNRCIWNCNKNSLNCWSWANIVKKMSTNSHNKSTDYNNSISNRNNNKSDSINKYRWNNNKLTTWQNNSTKCKGNWNTINNWCRNRLNNDNRYCNGWVTLNGSWLRGSWRGSSCWKRYWSWKRLWMISIKRLLGRGKLKSNCRDKYKNKNN